MLENVKLLLNITDHSKDPLLTLLIEQATEEALNYTHQNSIADLTSAIEKMVVYNYNRLGSEGADSESYSGVSFNYSTDYPENIMRNLRMHRKVIVID